MPTSPRLRSLFAFARVALLAVAPLVLAAPVYAGEEPLPATEIRGPAGSGVFGAEVKVLPNGNIVICDSGFSQGATLSVGAAYLYAAETFELISTLTGSQAGDHVCASGVTVLASGNFVVRSAYWDNGSEVNAGAVTFVNGTTGLNGEVSPANSLVGSHANDRVGLHYEELGASSPNGGIDDWWNVPGVVALENGNYVVNTRYWDNGDVQDAGASTWASGDTGLSGEISAANSLVGESASDGVGFHVSLVGNGNYVVLSSRWDAPGVIDAGAATWVDGDLGIVGTIDADNSLVGARAYDSVGSGLVTLTNGNYVVKSAWHSTPSLMVGAATWGRGATGITGVVSAANSLVGVNDLDLVGSVVALTNGNYVVSSPYWDNGAIEDVGAVTWGNGTTGVTGQVSTSNSLYGTTTGDRVGYRGITVLANGNYVVNSPFWSNGAATGAGAATWADGATGIVGPVSTTNSLYGVAEDAQVGEFGHAPLSNGNYVVCSPLWDNGSPSALNLGAATWGNGAEGTVGAVSAANSLVGSKAEDKVCEDGVNALENSNYVVRSSSWDNGALADAGAVTWGNGATGTSGALSASNSLVGGSAGDMAGEEIDLLANSNYVVRSERVDLDGKEDVGAATWGNGQGGTIGSVSASNSLVGASVGDRVGSDPVLPLANGNYVVPSRYYDHDSKVDVGAITWARADGSTIGAISETNSLIGTTDQDLLGWGTSVVLPDGSFYLASPSWLNPAGAFAASPQSPEGFPYRTGAATTGSGDKPVAGTISTANSFIGESATSGLGLEISYESGWSVVAIAFFEDDRVVFTEAADANAPIYLPFVSSSE